MRRESVFSAYTVNICTQTRRRVFHFPRPDMGRDWHSHGSEALESLAWLAHAHVKKYTITQYCIYFLMLGLYPIFTHSEYALIS